MSQRIPWLRVLAEGVVIVVSILLAFAVDAGWDGRQERRREGQFLEALSRDMRRTLEEIDNVIESNTQVALVAETFLERSPDELSSLAPDSADAFFDRLHSARTFSPFDAALRGFDVTSLTHDELRAALADWSMLLERVQRSNPYVLDSVRDMFFAGEEDAGFWLRFGVAESPAETEGSWAEVLAHMRRSPSFMSAVTLRQTTSRVARAQLVQLRESTVELLALLPGA